MHAYVDEKIVDLELSTIEMQIERVQTLPFELTAIVLSKIATHADHVRWNHERELELARELYGTTPIWKQFEALVRNRGMQAFGEQHFVALMRLLVLHGADAPEIAHSLDDFQWVRMSRSIIAMGTINDAHLAGDRSAEGWLAYLVQNGAYNHHEPALEAMGRAWALFAELPTLPGLADHRDAVPIEEWLAEQTFGLTLDQQFAIGFALLASANALDDNRQANDRNVIGDDRVASVAESVGVELDKLEAALSAGRDWYREQFSKTTGDGAAWDRVPFEQRPFLRLSDGRLCLWHVRFLMSWLTEGIHYRLLDAARRHKKVDQYTRYLGALTERYGLEVVRDAHAGPRKVGAGVVHGEQPYGGRRGKERKTPDVAIDWGPDLVLIEVASRRLQLASRRGGDPDVIRSDLDLMLGDKIEQLGRRVADLTNPKSGARIPGVDITTVHRIWPIVVTGAGLLENEILWDYMDEHSAQLRSTARVQPLTLLDLADLELLAGLVEHGHTVVELLDRKTEGPYARIDFRRFVNDDPFLPNSSRARRTVERWHTAMDRCAKLLGFTDEQIAQMRAA